MTFKSNTLRDAIALVIATGATAFAGGALAQEQQTQDDTQTLDRIEVTGSNIPRTTAETASPVQVITRQEIDRTGKTTVAEYLQTLTADGSGSVPKSFGAGFASGSAGISLRGLGAGSTLVLLNGRRMAPFGLADDGQKVFTDLSTIPLEVVERVEVLKDGASSIYGSDAIAGVVNIILRKDFTGAIVKGSYGTSGDSDGTDRKGSLTLGTGDLSTDGYNAFINIEGGKTDGIHVADRRDRKWIGNGDIRPYGYDYSSGFGGLAGFVDGSSASGSPLGNVQPVSNPNAPYQSLFDVADNCPQFSDVSRPANEAGCLWDTGRFRDISPTQSYLNVFSRGTFAISENAELYTEFGYTKKNSESFNTPSGVSGTWGYPGGPVNANSGAGATIIGADHPDNSLGVDARLRYAAFDVGPRRVTTENEFSRFLVGLKGNSGRWDYDVAYLHSQTSLDSERSGFLLYDRVQQVLTDGDNSPVGWWRLGPNAGENSQALYDYISPTLGTSASSQLDMVDAKASTSLADLRGGSLGLAFGAEYRRQTAKLTPVDFTDTGNVIGLGYSAYDGKEEVASAYAELQAPVLESLELSGAFRVDKYKDGETSTTPKVGIKWKPADWIALRGTYAEGFRAPNVAETAGASVGFANDRDPVRCAIENASNCNVGIAFIGQPNAALKPEESKSYTVGLVLDPTASTSVTLDAFKIERTNEIITDSLDTALAKGNDIRGDDLINGQPGTGTLLAVIAPYTNASSTTVMGFDVDARQRFDLGSGKLILDLQWTRINSFEQIEESGLKHEFAGTHGNCNVTNCIGTPKDRVNFGATWDVGDWSVSSVVNYRGKIDNTFERVELDPDGVPGPGACAAVFADGETAAPRGCELKSFYTVDLSGRWKPADAWEIFGSVQNLTDRTPPLDPTTYGALNYNPLDYSGAVGRYYTVGMKYTFN